jgi:hypothetical protein
MTPPAQAAELQRLQEARADTPQVVSLADAPRMSLWFLRWPG